MRPARWIARVLVGVLLCHLATSPLAAQTGDDGKDLLSRLFGARPSSHLKLKQIGSAAPKANSDSVSRADLLECADLVISADFLDKLGRQKVDESRAISRRVQGMPLRGKSRIQGETRVVLIPQRDRGAFEIQFRGAARSTSVTHSNPVRIHSRSTSRIAINKRFYLSDAGLESEPAKCRIDLDSRIVGVSTRLPGLRGRLARKIAWRRAHQSKAQFDSIVAQGTAQDAEREFERRAAPLATAITQALESDELRGEATPRRRFALRSTSECLYMTIRGHDRDASSPPGANEVEMVDGQAMILRLTLRELDVATAAALWTVVSELNSTTGLNALTGAAPIAARGSAPAPPATGDAPFPLKADVKIDRRSLTLTLSDSVEGESTLRVAQRRGK